MKNKLKKYKLFRFISKYKSRVRVVKSKLMIFLFGKIRINEVTRIMQKNGYNVFVDFGTLLGIIRDGRLIKDDLDLDFSFVLNDINSYKKIEKIFKDNGYYLRSNYILNGLVYSQQYFKSGIKFDIKYYLIENNVTFCLLFHKCSNQICITKHTHDYKIGLTQYKWKKIMITIPVNPNRILKDKYGSDWRIRKKKSEYVYWEVPNAHFFSEKGQVISF